MAIWLVRAGKHGQHQDKFLGEDQIYLTWDGLNVDLGRLPDRDALIQALQTTYPEASQKKLLNHAGQIWPFAHEIKQGDWVVIPLKRERAIQIGEVTGDYRFQPEGPSPYFHVRTVRWIGEAVPRSHFGQDLLYSFGAFMTICRIQRNDAEARLQAMNASGWRPESPTQAIAALSYASIEDDAEALDESGRVQIEEKAQDEIARLILSRFKGNELSRLVEGILRAQGYTTWRSPQGADGGADILAGAGPMGFGSPRLVIEVKSGDSPIDRPTVDKLLGAVAKFGADEGLFVSWGGYKNNVHKELAASFFRVRLWSQADLLEALYECYDRLDDDLRAELPLKKIWTLALPEGE